MIRRQTPLRTVRPLLFAAALAVCLTPLHAQDPSTFGRVVVLQGQVSVLKDNYPQALNLGGFVKPKQIIVTGADGYAKLELVDGSVVEVFPNAKVTFRDNYPTLQDLIQVWLGRIRVQIDHRQGPNPNRVSTPTAVISVRGTVFDVTTEDDDGTTVVAVEEGLVEVRHLWIPSHIDVHANEAIRVFRNQGLEPPKDHAAFARKALDLFKKAVYDYVINRPDIARIPGSPGGSPGGVQGDQSKTGNGGKTGGTGAPGAPPPPPGAPPPPPGGGGD